MVARAHVLGRGDDLEVTALHVEETPEVVAALADCGVTLRHSRRLTVSNAMGQTVFPPELPLTDSVCTEDLWGSPQRRLDALDGGGHCSRHDNGRWDMEVPLLLSMRTCAAAQRRRRRRRTMTITRCAWMRTSARGGLTPAAAAVKTATASRRLA